MVLLSSEEKEELLRLSRSKQLQQDFRRMRKNQQRHLKKAGASEEDAIKLVGRLPDLATQRIELALVFFGAFTNADRFHHHHRQAAVLSCPTVVVHMFERFHEEEPPVRWRVRRGKCC